MFVLDEMGNGTQERLKKYLQYISRICLNIQSIYSEQPDRKLGPVCTPKCENRLECLVSSYNWRSTKYNLQILPPPHERCTGRFILESVSNHDKGWCARSLPWPPPSNFFPNYFPPKTPPYPPMPNILCGPKESKSPLWSCLLGISFIFDF